MRKHTRLQKFPKIRIRRCRRGDADGHAACHPLPTGYGTSSVLSCGEFAGSPGSLLLGGAPPCCPAATSARTPLPAISISVVKAPIAPIVHITARPNAVNSTEATVASRKAPTNRVRTDAQVAAPPKAARRTAASSARDRRRKCDSCAAGNATSSASPPLSPS